MSDFEEDGGVDIILAAAFSLIAGGIGWLIGKLCGKQEAEKEKNEALKAKDEEINALKEKIADFIKAYDEQKLENSELLSMCEKLLAEVERSQKLPSDYKGQMIAQLKAKRLQLKRSTAA